MTLSEIMKDPNALITLSISVVVATNFALSGIAKGLEVIKDKTATKADDEAFAVLSKVVDVLSRVIDWVAPRTKQ